MNLVEHPQFNFSMRPDLGGTATDFVREITAHSLRFYSRDKDVLTKVEIPSDLAFVKVAKSEGMTGDFLELLYNPDGELTNARLYFTRYCEQKEFIENSEADSSLWAAYWQQKDHGEEILFEAELPSGRLFVYHGKTNPDGTFKVYSSAQSVLPPEGRRIIEVEAIEGDEFLCPPFAATFSDNTLAMGVCPNNDTIAQDSVSAYVNNEPINYHSKPGDVTRFLNKVYLKI